MTQEDAGHQVFWYAGDTKIKAWMADDEIALFTKKDRRRRIDISEVRRRYSETAEIVEQNEVVTFAKRAESVDTDVMRQMVTSVQTDESIGHISPVFYKSSYKDPRNRMALTGKLIVRYPDTFSEDQIKAMETEFGLNVEKTRGFNVNSFIYILNNAFKAIDAAKAMHDSGKVVYAYPDRLMKRAARAVPDDELFGDHQWHLQNTGQGGGVAGEDVDTVPVWDDYRGSPDEIIAIVDDGLEIEHEDLRDNVIPDLCFNYYNYDHPDDNDPTGGSHGTSCAGVAGAVGFNSIGVTGAAPGCGLAGYRLLDLLTDEYEADAMRRNNQVVDIYSNSWGPSDTGRELEAPGPFMLAALEEGTATGRNGLGSIFVWAGGNGYDTDNSNYDGYANSRFTIAVAASTNFGIRSDYSEKGANILVNAPSSGGTLDITTTDRHDDYTDDFGGTSSATPLVSGIIALMLQANPNLTWRDVQHILATTAKKIDSDDQDWSNNSGGYHVNHKYGFGRIDADSAVMSALNWETAEPEIFIEETSLPDISIPDNDEDGVSDTIVIDENIQVEFVEVYFTSGHEYWGDLEITLISPSQTKSILAEKHSSGADYIYDNWRFGTVRHYGETSAGEWTLSVKDLAYGDEGTFQSWRIKIYGTAITDTADLSVSIDDTRDPAFAGESIVYTIGVTNNNNTGAVNTVLKSQFDAVIKQATYSLDGDPVWRHWPGALNLGTISGLSTKTLYLKAQTPSSEIASLESSVQIVGRTVDPDHTNNTASETTSLLPALDLSDAVAIFKLLAGMESDWASASSFDINADNKTGLAEAIFILQLVAGMR